MEKSGRATFDAAAHLFTMPEKTWGLSPWHCIGMPKWQSDGSGAAVKSISEWLAENQPPELEIVPKAPAEAAPPNKTINSDYAEAFPFDDMQSSPQGHDFSGLIRPAHEYADAWDKMYNEATRGLEEWVDKYPSAWPVAAAIQTAMDVGKSDVDMLRLGKGMAEGGVGGVAEDTLRAAGLASNMAIPGWKVSQRLLPEAYRETELFQPYWKYISRNPETGEHTKPIYDAAGRLKDNVWLAKGKKPPYSLEEVKDKLQLPLPDVYAVERVDVPWYRPVRGPRLSYNAGLENDLGLKGGGKEYLTGPFWDETKNRSFTNVREWWNKIGE